MKKRIFYKAVSADYNKIIHIGGTEAVVVSFKQYEYFLEIVKHGSVTKAAEHILISQSALSKYLRRLEGELGAQLLDRSTIPLKLTPAGEIFLRYVTQGAAMEKVCVQQIAQLQDNLTETLRIGMWNSSCILPHFLPLFRSKYPYVKIEVIEDTTDAIAEATTVSAMRTGAVGGLAVKYLACERAETMLVCGAGAQGRTQLEAALLARPQLKTVYIYDLFFDPAQAYAEEMSKKLGVTIIPVENVEAAAREADIIVTVALANEPFIEADWLKKGCLLLQMADYEVTYDCVRKADKRIVDTWDGIKHRLVSTIALMAAEGLISDEDIYAELGSIINGKLPGRENDDEIIYFQAVGMGIEDICIVKRAYDLARKQGLGVELPFWED